MQPGPAAGLEGTPFRIFGDTSVVTNCGIKQAWHLEKGGSTVAMATHQRAASHFWLVCILFQRRSRANRLRFFPYRDVPIAKFK